MATGETSFAGLTEKTSPASGDMFLMEDIEDTKKINYDKLADAILNKLTSKTYSGLDTNAKNLIGGVNEVKSGLAFKGDTSDLNLLINQSIAGKIHIHVYAQDSIGNPGAVSGFVITRYLYSDNAEQWAYSWTGLSYYRSRSAGGSIGTWVTKSTVANLTTTIAGSPLDAIMGKLLNDDIKKSSFYAMLNNEDLNNLKGYDYVGRYYSYGGNTTTNRPAGVDAFGLEVKRLAIGSWLQILTPSTSISFYYRIYNGTTWTSWTVSQPTGSLLDLKTTARDSIVAAINELVDGKINNKMTVLPEGSNVQGVATNVGFYTVKNPIGISLPNNSFFNFIVMKTDNDINRRLIFGIYNNKIYTSSRSEVTNTWTPWTVFENTGTLSDLKTTNKNSIVEALNEVYSNKVDKTSLKASNVPITAISGMSATDVQGAIAELYSLIGK